MNPGPIHFRVRHFSQPRGSNNRRLGVAQQSRELFKKAAVRQGTTSAVPKGIGKTGLQPMSDSSNNQPSRFFATCSGWLK
jgi:hypothetical protein